jgi:hypothetical protein
MAEPLSSHEIEDVLSSIRRLVAQGLKPADRAKLAAVADISQKLVLKPENRVEEHGAPKFVTVRRPTGRPAFPAIDEVLPGMDAAAGLGPETARESKSDWSMGTVSAAEYIAPQPVPFILEPSARLSQVAPEEFADQGLGQQVLDPNDEHPEGHFYPADSGPVTTAWTEEPEDIDHLDTQDQFRTQSFDGTIEPDSDWDDEAEARVIAELAGEAMQETVVEAMQSSLRKPGFAHGQMAAKNTLDDEQALRSLVQTIFREEMAGPMGERITRNIRKLVRAEVGRMLAAHDLE